MNEDTVQQDMEKQTDLPDEMPYIRVGTSYYKIVYAPGLDGNLMRQRIPWNYATIKADHGSDYASHVPKYDAFTTYPSHINYQRNHGKFYNLYEPIPHKPCEGEFPHIQIFEFGIRLTTS